MLIPVHELKRYIFPIVTRGYSEKSECSFSGVEPTYDLPIIGSYALPVSYWTTLVGSLKYFPTLPKCGRYRPPWHVLTYEVYIRVLF